VLVGTDTGLGGFRYHDELQWLRQAGLSQADVLRAAAAGRVICNGRHRMAASRSAKPQTWCC
jgi:hypothetical protein